jgi:hypothetical protein
MAVRVGFEPRTASAVLQLADSMLLAMPNLPPSPPTIARYCTLRLAELMTKHHCRDISPIIARMRSMCTSKPFLLPCSEPFQELRRSVKPYSRIRMFRPAVPPKWNGGYRSPRSHHISKQVSWSLSSTSIARAIDSNFTPNTQLVIFVFASAASSTNPVIKFIQNPIHITGKNLSVARTGICRATPGSRKSTAQLNPTSTPCRWSAVSAPMDSPHRSRIADPRAESSLFQSAQKLHVSSLFLSPAVLAS